MQPKVFFFQDILYHPSPRNTVFSRSSNPPVEMVYGWAYHIRNSGKRLRSELERSTMQSMGKSTISMVSATIVGRRFNDKLANMVSFSSQEAGKKTVP